MSLRVWAPHASSVRVLVDGVAHPMDAAGDGWFSAEVTGTDYGFLLDDSSTPLPDPASRRQPSGVHGLSRVYDQSAFAWSDAGWAAPSLDGAVLYEMHVGTFTPGATFASAIERLDHLVGLGVTHVEVLPINAFNGVWNWGYDGVGWYAVHEPYGGPDGFKQFVDACHARGLAVILDVVYNHLGPSGNYLPQFGPYLRTDANTWGSQLDFSLPEVRSFVVDNAVMWLRDYHVDGLRIDAVHALGDLTVLSSIASAVPPGRVLIAESDLNDTAVLTTHGMHAQWADDVHHALHANLTGETQGYYADFFGLAVLSKVLTSAFFHDGTYSAFRERRWGAPVDRSAISGSRFVVFLQNHDQVGNRAAGDRLSSLCSPGLLRVGAVLLLTSPFTPMLWMGEEWAASTRWPFFTSHPEPELASAVSKGRLAEFASHGWDVSTMIDPQDPKAYQTAILDWSESAEPEHAAVLSLYRDLIALRHAEPDLRDGRLDRVVVEFSEDERWVVVHRGAFRVAANLSSMEREVPVHGEVVLATGAVEVLGSSVVLAAESAAVLRV